MSASPKSGKEMNAKEKFAGYSKRMKQYRLENGLKQSEMAQMLRISQQVYSLIEREQQRPKMDFILNYKKVTGIDLISINENHSNMAKPDGKLGRKYEDLRRLVLKLNKRIEALEKKQ
jgi:DNA-binding XRE family transcriptional regulator